ncbi:MAG: serine/threonine-protein kinase [Rikenellaceae bacterium]
MKRVDIVSDKGVRFSFYDSLEFRIGAGAMGEVFKGWETNNPNHKVAIKRVFSKHAEVPQIRERAKYEASICIDHPNIIKMLGYAQFDRTRGPIFIISELVRGTVVNKFVSQFDPVTKVDIVTEMMCSILDALTCLHTQNPPIWHRDIKPSNIMIENGINVRIMDLGIATSDGLSFGTIDGRGFGTYPYAPPEQITGKRGEVDGKSDIYSLGVTFYELLTDVNPFCGGSDIDIMEKQISMNLPPNPKIPKHIFKIILKATAKKKENRYQTAQEFKNDLLTPDINDNYFNKKNVIIFISCVISTILIITAIINLLN